MNPDNLQDVVFRFFESIGCSCKNNDKCVHVINVPEDFEKFFGKKSPYFFVFELHLQDKEKEYITKSSYLMKIINDYLEGKAETTLLKICFDFNEREKILEHFSFRNCKLTAIEKKSQNFFFERFTFLTTIQYKNEKEQITSQIFVRDGKTFFIDLNKFNVLEGKRREVHFDDSINKDYSIAKEELKKSISLKINEIEKNLESDLKREIVRIKNHFEKTSSEIESELIILKNKVKDLNAELSSKKDKKIEEKINRFQDKIKELQNFEKIEKAKLEEEFFIKDEIQKHSINIKTKLINTSIIYYPVFYLRFFSKTSSSGRFIEFSFNPLDNERSKINCDSCNKELTEIIICSSGHLTCRDCGERCLICKDIFCNKCLVTNCPSCGKKVCPKCILKCRVCKKKKCKNHFNIPNICTSCSKRCFNCGGIFSPEFIMKDSETGRDLCNKCYSRDVGRKVLNEIRK